MTTPIKIKRSGTASSTPSSLDHGELAINYADDTLFWKDSSNVIKSFVFQAYASATHASTHATGGSDALTPSDIGAAPAASPTFTGNINVSDGVIITRTNGPYVLLQHAGTAVGQVRATQGIVAVTNAAASEFQLCVHTSSGNVGIGTGTTTPASRLDVSGVITVSAGTAAAPAIVASGDSNTGAFFPAADTFAISTAGSERVRVDASGNVGIGTTSPSTLLDINADKIRLRTAKTPASASDTGNAGDICWDASYLYICTATNTWRRIAHSTW